MKTFSFPGHALYLPNIVRAENCSLFDDDGKRYVDMESGVWCTSVGHGNPAVKAAIVDQMESVGHVGFCYGSSVTETAAGAVQDLLGIKGGKCTFLCSGSEAVEYGVRAMRTVLDGKKIMTMGDSYFGAYGDATNKESGWFIFDWFDCADCGRSDCNDECPRWASIPLDDIGGFLLEPGSSSGLVRFPPAQLIESIVRAIHERDGLFMVNEVTTGVGRTGKWFGYQHYAVQPDVIALGKGIGNGYPVSVSAFGPRLADRLGDTPIAFGSSHFNDPLGASVVSAVIGQIEDNRLIDRAGELSRILLNGLESLADRLPAVKAVRGRGLMAVIELDLPAEETADFHKGLVEAGYICALRPGSGVMRMDPALTIEEPDLNDFLATLEERLGALNK